MLLSLRRGALREVRGRSRVGVVPDQQLRCVVGEGKCCFRLGYGTLPLGFITQTATAPKANSPVDSSCLLTNNRLLHRSLLKLGFSGLAIEPCCAVSFHHEAAIGPEADSPNVVSAFAYRHSFLPWTSTKLGFQAFL